MRRQPAARAAPDRSGAALVLAALLFAAGGSRPGSGPQACPQPTSLATPAGELPRVACTGSGRLAGALPLLFGQTLDLHRVGAQDLEALPGLGPVRAAALVAAREGVPPLCRPADLERVPGIGPRTRERVAPLLRFGDPRCAGGAPVAAGERPDAPQAEW